MLPPIDPPQIQPAMRSLVRWLRILDFDTTDSGDGVTNVQAGMEGALDEPHVFCRVEPDKGCTEARRLLMECRMAEFDLTHLRVEFMFSPQDEVGILALYGVTDVKMPLPVLDFLADLPPS